MSTETAPWTEDRVRAFMAEHTAFKRYAEPLLNQYRRDDQGYEQPVYADFTEFAQHGIPVDDGWRVRFINRYADVDEDDPEIHDMPIHVLWDPNWVHEAEARRAAWRAAEQQRREASERDQFERLKLKYEVTP